MSGYKILIVKSESDILNDLEKKLTDHGYYVLSSIPNSVEVLALALKIAPDLIIINVNLEKKYAGIETAIKTKNQINVPVIFLSIDNDEETYNRAKSANPIAYFSKPFNANNLFWAVELGLTNHKLYKEVIDFQNTEEKKLKEYVEELKRSNSAKDKFFSIISHDLRNPFNTLLGFSELLANNIEDLNEQEVKESAKSLHRTATNLYNLLTNLLEWSRLQTGNFTFEKSEFSISTIINHVLSIFSNSFETKNIKLIKETECELNVLADQNMIESAIRNIISNAIKFTNSGGTVTVGCRANDKYAEVYVQDNGVGIYEEDQQRLFKIDKQFSTEGTNYEKGTGFGLLLCKEQVEKNGGTIKFESKKNKGSTFIISLPIISNI